MDDYIKYVEEQLKIFRKETEVIDEGINEVTPLLINKSLAVYTQVNITINAEYQRKKKELFKHKNLFQSWWDERFVQIRREMNPTSITASKWLSKNEIESELRATHKEEYLKWKDEIDDLEMSKSFVLRLLDQWNTHSKILNTLSYNMQTELKSLKLGEMSSQPYSPVELLPERTYVRKKKKD